MLNLTLSSGPTVEVTFKSFEESERTTVAWVRFQDFGDKRLWWGIAYCSPHDEWSDTTGEKVALTRALAKACCYFDKRDRSEIWWAYWQNASIRAVQDFGESFLHREYPKVPPQETQALSRCACGHSEIDHAFGATDMECLLCPCTGYEPFPKDPDYETQGTAKVLDALWELSEVVARNQQPLGDTLTIRTDLTLVAGRAPRLSSWMNTEGVQ